MQAQGRLFEVEALSLLGDMLDFSTTCGGDTLQLALKPFCRVGEPLPIKPTRCMPIPLPSILKWLYVSTPSIHWPG